MSETIQRQGSILVVDDDPSIRQVLGDYLAMVGYAVYLAVDGESALEILKAEKIDLMVTDLGMPGISGWELAKATKRDHGDMPIVAITSWQGLEAARKLKEFGINEVVWKPFRFDQIKATIMNYLQ